MAQLTIADVYRARQIVGRELPPTPLLRSRQLGERAGCDVYVKYENLSPIRSFKARGALYCLSRLGLDEAGVVSASTGNHGQGIAFAARRFGRRAVVVVAEGANPQKMAAIRDLGADLRVHGRDLAEANEEARRIARAEGLRYVEDGEDPDVMLGCATLALEVVEQLPDFTHLLVPVGGGNLLGACALVVKSLRPDARLIGVQPEGAPAVVESWRAGRPLRLDRCATFAGGLATSYPGGFTFDYLRGVDDMLLVSDDAILDAAVTMLAATGHLPEGAGAAALAGLLADPTRFRGGRVVLLLTGGNYEPLIWQHLTGQRPAEPAA